MTPPQDEPTGSVGDEAAKLLGALADWAGDHLGGQVAGTARAFNDHVATGAAECLYCPVCRTVHAVRTASPEVKTQLASAASTFLEAAAGLLAAAGQAGQADQQTQPRVQRIDLDAEDAADPDDPHEDVP